METRLRIGPDRIADASGALFVESTRTLMIADAHLGYGWAQRRRGQMGPVTDGGIAQRLTAVVDKYEPEELVFLGDTVHAPKPMAAEREMIEMVLRQLLEKARVSVVQGNHDRAFARDFGALPIAVSPSWRHEGLLGLHGDRLHLELPEADHYVIGHVHPAIRLIDDASVKRRVPAFLVGNKLTLLPAFSPFAAGLDVSQIALPREVKRLLGKHEVYVVTGRQIALMPSRTNRNAE
ncbi:MAG: hypothetical protein FJW36_08375 [Acidobacteria bacterium]|nr:hypothetical protein [Acidobacteriota bacterium]